MIFSLDVCRARKGDCLLLHFGSKDEPGLVMIDGGPKCVYLPHLKPRLLEIREARGLDEQQALPVDLLMISHVDDDHIQGILDLTRELITNTPPWLSVFSFWHNSFDDIIGQDPKEVSTAVAAQFGAASINGDLPVDATIELDDIATDEDEEMARASLMVLASIGQGQRLRGDAERLGWECNPEFDHKLICAGKMAHEVADGLLFTVAGPMMPELNTLRKKHAEWLKTRQNMGEEALAAYVDRSVPNLSSIVVLASAGGKQMLLTGDARGDKILKGLELTGALPKGGTMHVDILKVPHHGSSNNLEDDFFKRITADHYVFSGNGEHGNPERESMEVLFNARDKEEFAIHLTYPIKEIDMMRKADWEKEQAKEKRRKANGGTKMPRKNWSPANQSLAAFFKARKLAKIQKLFIVPEEGPHVIDLLEPLGY